MNTQLLMVASNTTGLTNANFQGSSPSQCRNSAQEIFRKVFGNEKKGDRVFKLAVEYNLIVDPNSTWSRSQLRTIEKVTQSMPDGFKKRRSKRHHATVLQQSSLHLRYPFPVRGLCFVSRTSKKGSSSKTGKIRGEGIDRAPK